MAAFCFFKPISRNSPKNNLPNNNLTLSSSAPIGNLVLQPSHWIGSVFWELFTYQSPALYSQSQYISTFLHFSSVQLLSHVRLFATPWIAARQASLSITNSRSSPKLTCIESVMPSSHLILCHPLLLLPPIPPSIRVFSNESTLRMKWPKYWSFSSSISPSNEHPGLISLQSKGLTRVFSSTTVQKYHFFGTQLSL